MYSLYKIATKEEHTYETEGIFYFYKTCEESDLQDYLNDGWVNNFGELKGEKNEEVKGKETSKEVLEPAKRGRKPKAQ